MKYPPSLQEMISNIKHISDEHTIYVEQPWGITSKAIALSNDEKIEVIIKDKCYIYFLKVFIIKGLIEDLDDFLNNQELVFKIIQYAINDA
ncbi:hypothetical protein VXQ28_09850 [Acinetobacter oleivorans]